MASLFQFRRRISLLRILVLFRSRKRSVKCLGVDILSLLSFILVNATSFFLLRRGPSAIPGAGFSTGGSRIMRSSSASRRKVTGAECFYKLRFHKTEKARKRRRSVKRGRGKEGQKRKRKRKSAKRPLAIFSCFAGPSSPSFHTCTMAKMVLVLHSRTLMLITRHR